MTIIRNLVPQPLGPNAPVSTTGWRGSSDTLTAVTDAGQVAVRMTEAADDTGIYIDPNLNITANVGDTIRFDIDVKAQLPDHASVMRLRISPYSGAVVTGGTTSVSIPAGQWRRLSVEAVVTAAPSGHYFRALVWPTISTGSPTGAWIQVRRAMVQVGPSETIDRTGEFRDGDSPGWVWDGTWQASASRGPAEPYAPDAELWRNGSRVSWIDLLDGFEESAETGSSVTVTPFGQQTLVGVRPAPGGSGTLTAHFTRELADGTPGERSAALFDALREGSPMELRFGYQESGLNNLLLVPTGEVTRTLQRGRKAVWTVTFDYTTVVTPIVEMMRFSSDLTPERREIEFSGYTWKVRPTLDSNGPGPNAWSDSERSAFIDPYGNLNLSIFKDTSGVWRCVEVEGPQLGYGRYRWVVDTDPTAWTIEPVLGLFTYDDSDDGTAAYRELDIEFSKWNFAPEPSRNWYSVQPVQENAGAIINEHMTSDHGVSAATPYTCTFIWEPTRVSFEMRDANNVLLGQHVVTERIPAPYKETIRMNLWLIQGRAPADGKPVDVKIKSFEFTPGVTASRPAASSVSMDFSKGEQGFAVKDSGVVGGPHSYVQDDNLVVECNGADYSITYSGSVFDLTGSSVDVRVEALPIGGDWTSEALFMLRYSQHDYFAIFYSAGGMYGRVRQGGVNNTIFLGNENLPVQKYWRIREASGRVYFEFSANRSTWTAAGNLAHSYGTKLQSLRVRFESGFYGAEGGIGPFKIGGVNIT